MPNNISPSLLELQQQFEAVSSSFDKVFLVIDAFDECHQNDRKEILNGITRLFQHCSAKLKLCVTSRPEKDIKRAFTSTGFSTIKIEAVKVDQDISSFVQHQLQVRTHEYCTLNDEIRNEIESALVSKANGMFLWAKCQVDELFEQPSIADIRIALRSLPSDIDETYQRIVDKIFKQTSAMRALAAWALMWVITARRPLSLVEFAQLVATNPDKLVSLDEVKTKYLPRTVVDSCCGLIAVEEDIVRPIHYTVQEFLVREWPWHNGWDPINAHVQITQSCLRYLSLFDHDHIDKLITHGTKENKGFRGILIFAGELFDYIATSLPYHVKSCSAKMPPTLKGLLLNTLSDEPYSPTQYLLSLLHAWYIDKDSLIKYETMSVARYCTVVDMLQVYEQLFSDRLSPEELRQSVSLADAASTGSIKLVKNLLDFIGDVNMPDTNGHYALYGAIECHKPEMVKYLLDQGARIDAVSYNSTPISQCATDDTLVEIAQLLIDRGANLIVQEDPVAVPTIPCTLSPLHIAASFGQKAMLKLLLNQRLDINMQQWYYGSVLQAAAYGEHETIVKLLIELGAEVNAQGGRLGSALQAAAWGWERNKSIAMVKLLLDAGAEVNVVGGEFGTALQAAAGRGNESVVKLLLEAGAEVNVLGGEFGTALQAAVCRGNKSIVKLLLDAGADANIVGGKYGSALQAAGKGKEDIVKLLLDAGADVNISGGDGTALHVAAGNGKESIVKLLLDAGADVNISGASGTALHAAAAGKGESAIKLLLNAGAEVNNISGTYGTALQVAALSRNKSIVKLLLDSGADVNIVSGKYGTALQAAAAVEKGESVVKLLLDAGAEVNIVSGEFGTALQAAAACASVIKLQLLLNAGAEVNIVGGLYGTALQAAAYGLDKNGDSVKLLLDAGADVNIFGGMYGTALQAAASCRRLLDAGNVNIVNGKYRTTLQVLADACEKDESILKMLLDAGAGVNIVGGYYGTALHAAACGSCLQGFIMLLDAGANVHAIAEPYGTVLQAVTCAGSFTAYSVEKLKILLERGVDVNGRGGEYGTALNVLEKLYAKYAVGRNTDLRLLAEVRNAIKILKDHGAEVGT